MGADVIVTVRMPPGLVAALRRRIERDHYSDLSEQLRSVIRRGCLRYTDPVTSEMKDLKSQLKAELLKESADARTERILQDLKKLIGGGQ